MNGGTVPSQSGIAPTRRAVLINGRGVWSVTPYPGQIFSKSNETVTILSRIRSADKEEATGYIDPCLGD